MSHPIVISRIIQAGYQVFIPVEGGSEVLLKTDKGDILTCRVCAASADEENSSVLRAPRGYDLIGAYDPASKNVWIIPSSVLEDKTSIRLGKKYDEFLSPEPTSMEWKMRKEARRGFLEELKDRARSVGDKK